MTIGIYKIQNLTNGKIYIGQSTNVERRLKEHSYPSRWKFRIPVDLAIKTHGKDNFSYELIEECSQADLNSRETYWIQFYRSDTKDGYNCNIGGDYGSLGSNNGRAKLTEEDVVYIRESYNNHCRQKDIYEKFKEKISWESFQTTWEGRSWSHIMPEVFTEENREYYIKQACRGEKGCKAAFTNAEVLELRKAYQYKTAKELYEPYKDRVKFGTFQHILMGEHGVYSDVPLFGKAPKPTLTDEEVKESREYYITHTARQTFNHFNFAQKIPFGTFKHMLEGLSYNHLPWYSKKYKQWMYLS